jgi:hypothetical protein
MMKKGITVLSLILLISLLPGGAAEGKWWIFGQSEGTVETRYLFINGISYDQSGSRIILYKDMLQEGMIYVRGRAQAAGNKRVGAVQVSIDGKQKWDRAKLADDGTMEYMFTPEIGRTYKVYVKIIDTVGKTNDIDKTFKEVTVSDRNILGIVKEALEKLFNAYRKEDPAAFMALVNAAFTPDRSALERAVRKDFTLLDNINFTYTLNAVASDPKGNVLVSITFGRTVTSTRTGKSFSDKGTTELALALSDGSAQLFSMKSPLIFGLSDGDNVSSGTVSTGGGDQVIIIDGRGEVKVGSVDDSGSGKGGSASGGGSGSSGSGAPAGATPGIPAPTKLTASGMKHHMVDLSFEHPFGGTGLIGYEVVAEEATAPGGPWFEVVRKPGDTFVRVMSQLIAQKAILLYYRVRIVKGSDSSPTSNVVTWDNQ